jgi:hypothetical protein
MEEGSAALMFVTNVNLLGRPVEAAVTTTIAGRTGKNAQSALPLGP